MVALEKTHAQAPYSFVDSKLSQDGRFGWFLAMWHPQQHLALEELGAELRLAILNSDASTVSRMEVEKWLKGFMGDLHWKMHALLRKTELSEKGLSIFFGIIYDHELFFVQFGRIICAVSDGKKLSFIGPNHRDIRMQTLQKLNLLGLADSDIKVTVRRVFISQKDLFVALSGNLASQVFDTQSDLQTLSQYIESYAGMENPLWLILRGKTRLIKARRRKLSRLQISSIIMLVLTVIATLYVAFGNRFLDQALHRTRINVKRNRTLRLDQIPNNLSIETQNFLKYLDRIVNLPARNIEMDIMWSATLPYQVTSAPVFSLDTIYLAADNNLIAFDKKTRELKWKKSFDSKINSVYFADNILVTCLENETGHGFREDGSEVWQMDLGSPFMRPGNHEPSRVGPEDDPRLDRAITIFPSARFLWVVDITRGENLSTITFKDDIRSISAYDSYANCFYAIVDDGLLCIHLKIAN
jgi:outer membrane protein assembly factor BamB